MTRTEAIQFVLDVMIGRLGGGYHPDNDLSEYIWHNNGVTTQSFTDEEIARLQPMHDEACKVLGDKIYDIALSAITLEQHIINNG